MRASLSSTAHRTSPNKTQNGTSAQISSAELISQTTQLSFYFFTIPRVTCTILVPQPAIEPTPLAMEALETQNLNHWTAKVVHTQLSSLSHAI